MNERDRHRREVMKSCNARQIDGVSYTTGRAIVKGFGEGGGGG